MSSRKNFSIGDYLATEACELEFASERDIGFAADEIPVEERSFYLLASIAHGQFCTNQNLRNLVNHIDYMREHDQGMVKVIKKFQAQTNSLSTTIAEQQSQIRELVAATASLATNIGAIFSQIQGMTTALADLAFPPKTPLIRDCIASAPKAAKKAVLRYEARFRVREVGKIDLDDMGRMDGIGKATISKVSNWIRFVLRNSQLEER